MTHEVLINGDRYVKALPVVPREDQSEIEAVLAATINYEYGAGTVRLYLHDLLETLWEEEANFSSKHPFGEGGWVLSLHDAIGRAGIVSAEIDKDGYIKMSDDARKQADHLIAKAINYIFFGAELKL
ncbi:MAG: hypothetical protein H7Z11_16960 [Verrucomicrobia bacterium]|nr:hypothetical protein [Leptolyngbya sp. ES-bin-22]